MTDFFDSTLPQTVSLNGPVGKKMVDSTRPSLIVTPALTVAFSFIKPAITAASSAKASRL